MRFETLDPTQTDCWEKLVGVHTRSFVHSPAWAEVLRNTYGHRPCYVAGWAGDTLAALLPLMEVDSPLTGRRGVSLPFLDHCAPLLAEPGLAPALFQEALRLGESRAWKFLEVRGWSSPPAAGRPSVSFTGHHLELNDGPDALFERLDPGIRRGIRKAGKEGVECEVSTSLESLREFYRLHCLTRGKHGAPPQPFALFENILRSVLAKGLGMIVTASVGREHMAASVFFHDGSNALYKYGASDPRQLGLRGNNLVMWEAIKWYAARGYQSLDFGRTSENNAGLRRFKRGFGAEECRIDYWKYHFARAQFVPDRDRSSGWFTPIFRRMPRPIARLVGTLLYPHLS